MNPDVVAELAPTGVLRAAINLSNFLLVSGKSDSGDPVGVAPDMAAEVAKALGVPVRYVTYPSPGHLADAGGSGSWDIGLIGAEPQRMGKLAFTAAYSEIQASYLVWAESKLRSVADVDQPGVRISVMGRSAYGLWLERNIKNATLMRTDTTEGAVKQFVDERLDALASLQPALLKDVERIPGTRIIDGHFTAVQQAICTAKENGNGLAFLVDFVEQAKATGLVARLIERHQIRGLSVAPKAG